MLLENNFIKVNERPNLFETSFFSNSNEEEKELLEEEKEKEEIIDEELQNLEEKPKIRVLTPVRKKEPDFKDIFTGDNFKKLFPMPNVKALQIDYSDSEEVNERVRKLINNSSNVDYREEHEKVKEAARDAFELKYKAINANYPEHSIKFNRDKNLNLIHKNYHGMIRSIYSHMNIGQTRLGYILLLLVLEVVCIKVFSLPMAGLTKMEMKRMYKYNSLMIELGESMCPATGGDGGESQSIEWRIASAMLWNVIVFLGIKLLSNYMGGESMIDTVRGIVDKLFENNISFENIESGEAKKINSDESELFSGLFDGNGDGSDEIGEFISSLGSAFTKNMESNRKGPSRKARSRVIFDD